VSYRFTENWFSKNANELVGIIELYKPISYLEIGSFEGRSACAFMELVEGARVTCIDPWLEPAVEALFDANTAIPKRAALRKIKGYSVVELPKLLTEGERFDMIYIDGSHTAPDVLADAVMAFGLCRVGGVMIFDDYLWPQHGFTDALETPKPGVDAFVNCYRKKLKLLTMLPLWQFYVEKTAE